VATVRFETRSSGPGPARTFQSDTGEIIHANPVDSLDWPDYVAALTENPSAQPVDDVAQG
jgi:DNA polymerase-4